METESGRRFERIRKYLECQSYYELSKLTDIPESKLSKWKSDGSYRSTEKLLDFLMDSLEDRKISQTIKRKARQCDNLTDRLVVLSKCSNQIELSRQMNIENRILNNWRKKGLHKLSMQIVDAIFEKAGLKK